jgi:hypothetical protein
MSPAAGNFLPYSPAAALPYAHHWRLTRNPNDTFLAGNTHREGISPFDDLQPAEPQGIRPFRAAGRLM